MKSKDLLPPDLMNVLNIVLSGEVEVGDGRTRLIMLSIGKVKLLHFII